MMKKKEKKREGEGVEGARDRGEILGYPPRRETTNTAAIFALQRARITLKCGSLPAS